jgi:putative transposase
MKTKKLLYRELENKFPDKKYRQMVIMPNHFHCIIENTISETTVGTDLRVCPGILQGNRQFSGKNKISGNHISLGEYAGSPLQRAVQWFKTMTTNAYIRGVRTKKWPPFDKKLWQRNCCEQEGNIHRGGRT